MLGRPTVTGVVVIGLAIGVLPAFAHLSVTRSEPAHESTVTVSPKRVTVWFSQNPVLAVSALRLEGPRGDVRLGPVEAGADRSLTAEVLDTLEPGRHTLTWRTAGNDGHVLTGTRTFTYAPPGR